MAQLGADVEQLDQLSKKFDQEGDRIAQATSQISSQVNSTWWKGPDADRFRNEWEGPASLRLRDGDVVEGPGRREVQERVGGPVRFPAQEDRRGPAPGRHRGAQAGPAAAPDQLRLTRRSTHGGRQDHGAITTCPRPLPRPGAPSRPGPCRTSG